MSLKDAYMKERRRIQSFLRSAKKRNYIFPDDVLPAIPKKITDASIRRLKKLTPKELYKKAYGWVESTTGELKSAARGLIEARKRGRLKAQRTQDIRRTSEEHEMLSRDAEAQEIIGQNFIMDVESIPAPFEYQQANKDELIAYLRGKQNTDMEEFARVVQKNALNLQLLISSYVYASDDTASGEIFEKIQYLLE